MSNAQMLRKHHRSLVEMAHEIEKSLGSQDLPARTQAVIYGLSRMTGLLALHLAMEDKVMYPRLLGHRDGEVGAKARRFLAEVGGFKETFEAYRRKWMRPCVIESAWEEFSEESRSMLQQLRNRIALEEKELYQLVERIAV